MKFILRQLELPLDYNDEDLPAAAARRLKCDVEEIIHVELVKRSIDARPRRPAPLFIAAVKLEMAARFRLPSWLKKDIEELSDELGSAESPVKPALKSGDPRPVVVGAGPAGLMAAWHLAMAGLKPILIERGDRADRRKPVVDNFWRTGAFAPENNALYGEGGAGLFSDGKLTARSKDRPRIRTFFETLVRCGAPRDILIDAEPHLGSDVLLEVVASMRQLIEANGGETLYNTALTDLICENGAIIGIKCGDKELSCNRLILATGHSARDVYRLLQNKCASLESKPLAVGIRLEAPQAQINMSQYGRFAGHPRLKAASYRVTRRPENNARACYSFCMCPGGLVICCASEHGALTTNGMSYSGRDSIWGNAAFIVPVEPGDFADPAFAASGKELAGMLFQEKIEKAAFTATGGDFVVPALMLADFLADKVSASLPANRSCPRSKPASFDNILPDFVTRTLRQSIPPMLRELGSINIADCIVYAAETRSSSSVRILRDDSGQSPTLRGLFPTGEGAGYAGGIVSSAVDGLKAAEQLIESLC
ncbi:MAG: NAD(FAD)-utilizing dehydrogenase [Candidatus Rifleibacterium amylolyticum]|nr:MAG: NAD(FAD)-utilizing dehydrogenase [Candidatus Rifleibacterium amylolyticum]